jgi:hypothetical protein
MISAGGSSPAARLRAIAHALTAREIYVPVGSQHWLRLALEDILAGEKLSPDQIAA